MSIDDICPFCGRKCHVPLTRAMPDRVYRAYEVAGLFTLATCEEGIARERRALGVSYDNVVAARIEAMAYPPKDSN